MSHRFKLVGGVDPDERSRIKFAETFHCSSYHDIDEALIDNQPDVVALSNPTDHHAITLLHILKQIKPRAVLCEKPLSYSLSDAESMVRACNKAGVQLFVNYMRRSDPAVVEIKKRLEANEIKPPIKGVAWYSKGFIHNGSHLFNLLEYWLGKYKSSKRLSQGRSLLAGDQEFDVLVTFEQGEVIFLSAWEEVFSHYTIELLSTSGRLRYEYGGEHVEWSGLQSDPYFLDYTILSNSTEAVYSGMKHYQRNVVDQLVNALDEKEYYLCSGEEALCTLKNMQQILE